MNTQDNDPIHVKFTEDKEAFRISLQPVKIRHGNRGILRTFWVENKITYNWPDQPIKLTFVILD